MLRGRFMVWRIGTLVFIILVKSEKRNPVYLVRQFQFVLLRFLAVIMISSLVRSETWTPCNTVSLLPWDKVNLGLSWPLLSKLLWSF